MVQSFWPNEADAFHDNQAEPDSVDAEILLLGYQRTGVISGCAVTESSPAAQTVDVAVGEVIETGEQISVSAQPDVAVSAASGSNPRFDLITINSSGTVVVTPGTAAAQPVFPAIPASSVPLAALYIPISDNTHADEQISDKRVLVADRFVFNVKDFGATGDGSTDDTTAIQAAFDAADAAQVFGVNGPVVVFPPGDYRVVSVLTWKQHDIVAMGQTSTRIKWDAAGGTCIQRTTGTASVKGLRFVGGTGKPDIWLDLSSDSTDYGDWLEDCFFTDWNDTTGECAIKTGSIVNLHMRRVRFGGGKGYCIVSKSSAGTASFDLTQFTVDFSGAAANVFKGVLHQIQQNLFELCFVCEAMEAGFKLLSNDDMLR